VTSALASPALKTNVALGYVRKEANQVGNQLVMQTKAGESAVTIVDLPFKFT
jgi:glycine cleavage system aminomethyltransferase T